MIKETHYICSDCNTEYKEESNCTLCEESHSHEVGIVKVKFESNDKFKKNYPSFIYVEMDDGEIIRYRRAE